MRSRLAAAGLLLAVFGFGAVAGGVGVSMAEHRDAGGGSRGRGLEGYMARMTTELGLSEVQRDSLRDIMDRHKPAMDSMWGEVRPRFDSLRAVVRSEIREQLDPAQVARYDSMLAAREQAIRERRSNGSG